MGKLFHNKAGKVIGAAITGGEHFRHPPTLAPWEPEDCAIEKLPSEFAAFEKVEEALQEAKGEGLIEKDYLIDTDGKKIELK